jgi:hypothetical protein
MVVHWKPTDPLGEGAVAKAMADESVFAKASTRQGGPRNMRFCETNRIGNRVIFNISIRRIMGCDDSVEFFNPVRLESFSAGSE